MREMAEEKTGDGGKKTEGEGRSPALTTAAERERKGTGTLPSGPSGVNR
jgi:hypothetical protein